MMTVEAVKKEKVDLETSIEWLIRQFEKKTETNVTELFVIRDDNTREFEFIISKVEI